jgi:hypothetical protein
MQNGVEVCGFGRGEGACRRHFIPLFLLVWVASADATLASPRTGVCKRKAKPAKFSGLS